MRLNVLFDKQGKIVAATRVQVGRGDLLGQSRPVGKPEAGHSTAEVHVPAEHAQLDLAEVCERLVVDVKGKLPTLRVKD